MCTSSLLIPYPIYSLVLSLSQMGLIIFKSNCLVLSMNIKWPHFSCQESSPKFCIQQTESFLFSHDLIIIWNLIMFKECLQVRLNSTPLIPLKPIVWGRLHLNLVWWWKETHNLASLYFLSGSHFVKDHW